MYFLIFEGPGYDLDDNVSNRLQYIPLYYPIIKSKIGLKDDQKHKELSIEPVISCLFYDYFNKINNFT